MIEAYRRAFPLLGQAGDPGLSWETAKTQIWYPQRVGQDVAVAEEKFISDGVEGMRKRVKKAIQSHLKDTNYAETGEGLKEFLKVVEKDEAKEAVLRAELRGAVKLGRNEFKDAIARGAFPGVKNWKALYDLVKPRKQQ